MTIATIPKWYQRINSSSSSKPRRIKMIRRRNDSTRLSLQNPGIQHRGRGESHREHGGLAGEEQIQTAESGRLISLWLSVILCVLCVNSSLFRKASFRRDSRPWTFLESSRRVPV